VSSARGAGPARSRRPAGARRRSDFVPLAATLGRWRRHGGTRAAEPGADLEAARRAWAEVGGPAVARESVPLRVSRGGALTVACSGAAWAQELAARSEELLARLRAAGVEARGLRFVVADVALPPAPEAPAPAPRPPTAGERAAARVDVGPVADPHLRELLVRAAAARRASSAQ
jgi:hypothetical protein